MFKIRGHGSADSLWILHLRSVNRQKKSPAALDMSDSEFSAMVQALCRLGENCNNVIRAPSNLKDVLARALHLTGYRHVRTGYPLEILDF